ncbi:Hypothetical Protein FCC1311_003502 [Hondaea fermentalgiana]|uniref:ABM domain-containing protein n=1 Tax=Hondaea fermentalgiana TaxID=2315210 RepID=A0A2R5FZF3_9STRA|nr:Hypothetical Protein FCC1311_003502 [Hondaea fermentalgiana]|eukprot:GBG24132.1 Hypothetical Protein FCC1311_003502 [Hondaea fermentalgiana]
MAGRVRVLSERLMVPGKEKAVRTLMLNVERNVRNQPGFVKGEILKDVAKPSSYLILTEWESMKHLNRWFDTPFYKNIMSELNETLQEPASYRILRKAKEEVFLL